MESNIYSPTSLPETEGVSAPKDMLDALGWGCYWLPLWPALLPACPGGNIPQPLGSSLVLFMWLVETEEFVVVTDIQSKKQLERGKNVNFCRVFHLPPSGYISV